MKKTLITSVVIFSIGFVLGNKPINTKQINQEQSITKGKKMFESQQIAFEENKGQIIGDDASNVKFIYKDNGLSIFLLKNGLAYQFNKTHYPDDYKHLDKFIKSKEFENMEVLQKDTRTETYRMDVYLEGANSNARITTEGKSLDYVQYYNHNALEVHSYTKIIYHDVYPYIDWVIYKTNKYIKYDFVVHPGGDPKQIKLQTKWVEDLTLNKDGSLTLKNRMGSITEKPPISFQSENEIQTNFNLEKNTISFNIQDYDPSLTLIIDPNLIWGTYYGGVSAVGESCTVDGAENVYLTGWTSSSSYISSGGHQDLYGGNWDAFLVKFNSAGIRQWATYYGGNNSDYGKSCAVDGYGNVYLAGNTESTNNIALGGHQNIIGGNKDAFLAKFDSQGIRLWGTYYGGTLDDSGISCAVDVFGNVFLAGFTKSTNNISFGGHQNTKVGFSWDAFLVKFDSAGVSQWGTYYGGNQNDKGLSCATDSFGNVFLSGDTESSSNISSGGHQNIFGNSWDAFLVKFNSNGIRQWGTYYGGSMSEVGRFICIDSFDNVYLTGQTNSFDSISSGGHQNSYGGSGDAFLVKFNSLGIRQWATYFGGSESEDATSCAVDSSGNVFLAGYTQSMDSIASGGHQNIIGGNFDAFLVKFNNNGVRQWATYYGGSAEDRGYSCAVDGSGNAYLAGETGSSSNIGSEGHQDTIIGNVNAFLAKFDLCGTSHNLSQTICSDSSYVFAGQTLTNSGLYSDTITTIGGCDSIINLNLTVLLSVTPSITISVNIDTITCHGQQFIFTASITNGGTSPLYHWKLNDVNVGFGLPTFTSTFINNGDVITCELLSNEPCSNDSIIVSNAITISLYPLPSLSISQNMGDLEATAGYLNYVWKFNNIVITGATTNVYSPSINGTYEVEVTDSNTCKNNATYIYNSNNISSPNKLNLVSVFPNPAQNQITLFFSEDAKREIEVYDVIGKLVFQKLISQEQEVLFLNNLTTGIYQIKIIQDGYFTTKQLIINR